MTPRLCFFFFLRSTISVLLNELHTVANEGFFPMTHITTTRHRVYDMERMGCYTRHREERHYEEDVCGDEDWEKIPQVVRVGKFEIWSGMDKKTAEVDQDEEDEQLCEDG